MLGTRPIGAEPKARAMTERVVSGRSRVRVVLLWTGVFGVLMVATCGGCVFLLLRGDRLPTVGGPEAPALVDRLRGTLVYNDWHDARLEVVSFPSRAKRAVVLERGPDAFSAFDVDGNLAYVSAAGREHEVRLVSPNAAAERVLLRGTGEISTHTEILISPRGGRVAFVRALHTGGFHYENPELFVMDLAGTTLHHERLGANSVSEIEWAPNGERLTLIADGACSALTIGSGPIERLEASPSPTDSHAVMALELESAAQFSKFPLGSRFRTRPAPYEPQIPGRLFGVLGRVDESLVVYEGLPTTGSPQPYNGAFLVWPTRAWSIKVADMRSGAFATLVPEFGIGRARFGPTPADFP